MRGHKSDYNCGHNVSSINILCYDDAYMEVIEEWEDEDRDALEAKIFIREGHFIRTMDCVNIHVPNRTRAEWREDNKEYLKEYDKIRDKNIVRKEQKKTNALTARSKERKKIYDAKQEHKEQLRIRNSEPKHKEQVKLWKSTIITCECGSIICQGAKSKHIKSIKHQTFILG